MTTPFVFETESFEGESAFEQSPEMFETEEESRRRRGRGGRRRGRCCRCEPPPDDFETESEFRGRRVIVDRRRRPLRFSRRRGSFIAPRFIDRRPFLRRRQRVRRRFQPVFAYRYPFPIAPFPPGPSFDDGAAPVALPDDTVAAAPAVEPAAIEEPADEPADAGQEFFEYEDEYYEGEEEEEVNRSSREYGMWVQQSLNRIMGLRLAVDGIIGTQTRSAVRSFQQQQRLTADGIVGPITEAAMVGAGAGNPPQDSGAAPSPYTPGAPSAPAGGVDIVNVRGIKVARQIAANVDSLLAAAGADGVRLGGGGYRSPEQQIELRRQHCGPTHYDIYEKPSSQCHPPTATPGHSNHERGLAIDFTYNGGGINSHDNPAFVWLAANAARFGLYNLASEPWHWSVDGR